jgi:hypothetical protein
MPQIAPAKIPFYSNTQDNTHCFQASIKMVLGYFLPDQDFSWEELDRLSAKTESMATWPQRMLINLQKMGFTVASVGNFDGRAFIRDGAKYLQETLSPEVADWQIGHSDLSQAQKDYQAAYDQDIDIQKRIPELTDLQAYQQQGYIVSTKVNSHRVVILAIDEQGVVLHDPGLPPYPALRVPREQFVAAWAYPDRTAQSFTAITMEKKI